MAEYSRAEDAARAIKELDGQNFAGRKIRLREVSFILLPVFHTHSLIHCVKTVCLSALTCILYESFLYRVNRTQDLENALFCNEKLP